MTPDVVEWICIEAARLLAQTGSEKLRQAPRLLSAIVAALVRAERRGKAEGLREAWTHVNARIIHGQLPGNGSDKTAERNGLVFAANILMHDLLRAAACEEGTG